MTIFGDRRFARQHSAGTQRPRKRSAGLGLSELAKFAAAAALLAMLADAAVGHAIAWQNDPYWTYWITDTFLIATVIGLGTAWLGIGPGRGAALILVQTAVLTVYYWSLSPVGLPSSPEWLDLEHTWLSGAPIHFGVYYLGYLGALWLWRRRGTHPDKPDSTRGPIEALAVALAMVLSAGILQAMVFAEFQGVTWYVVRLVIVVPILLLWQGVAGRDVPAAIGGAVVLTGALTAYSHFLGPVRIPDAPPRIFERAAPGAAPHWLDYRDSVLVAMPITFVVVLIGFLILSRDELRRWRPGNRAIAGLVGAVALPVAAGALAAPKVGPDADGASVSASGTADVEVGTWFSDATMVRSGDFTLTATRRNPRITPLPPYNTLLLSATVHHPDGQNYTIIADRPMIADPLGRFNTWSGVGLDVWQHGRSGIGDQRHRATHSDVAVFALGAVSRDGHQIAANVPIHAMTTATGAVELHVGDPQGTAIAALPDGHLRVAWNSAQIAVHQASGARYFFGGVLLATLLALAGLGVRAQTAGAAGVGAYTRGRD